VLLAVSELVTNAVLYAPGPCTLEVALDEQGVRIAVTDSSSVVPAPRVPDRNGSGGLGLHMLHVLAGEVETRLHEGGKTVRVRVPRTTPGRREPDGSEGDRHRAAPWTSATRVSRIFLSSPLPAASVSRTVIGHIGLGRADRGYPKPPSAESDEPEPDLIQYADTPERV
jgi:hypothetical protein